MLALCFFVIGISVIAMIACIFMGFLWLGVWIVIFGIACVLAIYTINYYQIKSYKPTIHDVIRDRMEEMGSSYIFGFSSEVDCIESAYNAVQFKKNFFLGKSDSIQRAFNLLEERATRNYNRAIEFMKNYDFENNQNASYIIKLADSSNFVKQKLEELENLVWEVEDSTSSTDMSYINDFTQVLSNMIEKEDEEDAQ